MPATAPSPAVSSPTTLLELTEPIFQYVCRLNRAARQRSSGLPAEGLGGETADAAQSSGVGRSAGRGLSLDYAVVRAEVKALLEDFPRKAGSDYRLASQAQTLELPLMFFADALIAESKLPFAAEWNRNRLAYERNELAGDEAFFDLLEQTLKDPSPEASERLAVFYLCLGLGFTGIYSRQPEYLRKTMLAIAPRIRHWMDSDLQTKLCPEIYGILDTRNLVQPPNNKLVIMGILLVCFTLAVLVSYLFMYQDVSSVLGNAIRVVLEQDQAK